MAEHDLLLRRRASGGAAVLSRRLASDGEQRLVGGSNLAQSAAMDCSGPAMDAAMEIDTERVRRARSVALSYVLGEVFASQL